MRSRLLFVLAPIALAFLFAICVTGVAQAQSESGSATELKSDPPGGLWGDTLQSEDDKGIKKATGNAYNYTHIALSCLLFAAIGGGIFLLVRHQTRDRGE